MIAKLTGRIDTLGEDYAIIILRWGLYCNGKNGRGHIRIIL